MRVGVFLMTIIISSVHGMLSPRVARAAEPAFAEVAYATVGEHDLLLDIYAPDKHEKPWPTVIWVHGGAWRSGSRAQMPLSRWLDHGFAIASVDYRLSPVARFPAQVHDIKAAIRFLRSQADKFGLDRERFVIAGGSAGGHLAALAGVSHEVAELEGQIGKHLMESSQVQAIVSFYGASNLQTILAQSTPHGLNVRVPALQLLLGGQPEEKPDLARMASPVAHVTAKDPPLLLIHGDQDPQMPINQAHELEGAYERLGLTVRFEVVHGGKHGGAGFYEDDFLDRLSSLVQEWLLAK